MRVLTQCSLRVRRCAPPVAFHRCRLLSSAACMAAPVLSGYLSAAAGSRWCPYGGGPPLLYPCGTMLYPGAPILHLQAPSGF